MEYKENTENQGKLGLVCEMEGDAIAIYDTKHPDCIISFNKGRYVSVCRICGCGYDDDDLDILKLQTLLHYTKSHRIRRKVKSHDKETI